MRNISQPTDKRLLTIADLMETTQESESAWRKRIGKGELPVIRLGVNVRIRPEDFKRWLKARTTPAARPKQRPESDPVSK